jgi:molybdopterin-guanine dinucleotide biosynthesis protein A
LHAALQDYLQQGGRRVSHWMAQQQAQIVLFNQEWDYCQAFENINTLAQLQGLECG